MDALLVNLQPGVLSKHIEPLRSRIRMLLDDGDHRRRRDFSRRIRVVPFAAKAYRSEFFQDLCQALLARRCVDMTYYSRPSDSSSKRRVSPQRLIYYRDNWYLDAWCHLRQGLRSFSIDAITALQVSAEEAIEVDEAQLNRELESGLRNIFRQRYTGRAPAFQTGNCALGVARNLASTAAQRV